MAWSWAGWSAAADAGWSPTIWLDQSTWRIRKYVKDMNRMGNRYVSRKISQLYLKQGRVRRVAIDCFFVSVPWHAYRIVQCKHYPEGIRYRPPAVKVTPALAKHFSESWHGCIRLKSRRWHARYRVAVPPKMCRSRAADSTTPNMLMK